MHSRMTVTTSGSGRAGTLTASLCCCSLGLTPRLNIAMEDNKTRPKSEAGPHSTGESIPRAELVVAVEAAVE